MAKELPYFRFTASEWLQDDISLESYESKGLFADVCAYYWMQDCDCTLDKLKKKFSNATILLDQLIKSDIIKHENKHDKIKIDFLLTQYDLLSEKRKLRQDAGSKGGNAKAMLKQNDSYKDNNKDNNKDNSQKSEFNFDFVEPNFRLPFLDWYKYKIAIKKPFKIQVAIESCYRELKEMANNRPFEAIKIVQYSIAREYQSLCLPDKKFQVAPTVLQTGI